MKGFRKTLADRQTAVKSLVCVGLDPLKEKLPICLSGGEVWQLITDWMCGIVEATAPFASMYKLQRASYESILGGEKALRKIIEFIHARWAGIPVFIDCKRGDIKRSQEQYRIALFDLDCADGINFSPSMGKDCMEALIKPGKAIVGLCYTSNPSAREVQDVIVETGEPYWEFIGRLTYGWAKELNILENAGLVMAAAHKKDDAIYSYHLERIRELFGSELWFLIPGIGTQKGFVEATVRAAYVGPGTIAINSSSKIIFASSGEDYAIAAGKEAARLCDEINAAI